MQTENKPNETHKGHKVTGLNPLPASLVLFGTVCAVRA